MDADDDDEDALNVAKNVVDIGTQQQMQQQTVQPYGVWAKDDRFT